MFNTITGATENSTLLFTIVFYHLLMRYYTYKNIVYTFFAVIN